jgi:hypothetical protein
MGIMSRPPGDPRNRPPVTAAPLPELIPGEQCDRCGAAPRYRVKVPGEYAGFTAHRDLLFCAHHYRQHESAIAAAGYRVL